MFIVLAMRNEYVTTDELKAAWQRANLWRTGISFSAAMRMPLVAWSLRMSALAARRKNRMPVQPALF